MHYEGLTMERMLEYVDKYQNVDSNPVAWRARTAKLTGLRFLYKEFGITRESHRKKLFKAWDYVSEWRKNNPVKEPEPCHVKENQDDVKADERNNPIREQEDGSGSII
jgi:hypothetical protein